MLGRLARYQARTEDDPPDAEPGQDPARDARRRDGRLGEVPFALYYGSVDATPLFVVLAGSYSERTGDLR